MSANKIPEGGFQATDASERRIKIIYRDRVTETYTQPVWVKRAELSKFYYESRVIGALNGITVVEI